MAVLAAAIVLSACLTWRPPFSYRRDDIAARAIIARVPFAVEDAVKTELARQRAKDAMQAYYRHRPEPIVQLRASLKNKLFLVKAAESFDTMTQAQRDALEEFYGNLGAEESELPSEQQLSDFFSQLKASLQTDNELKKLDAAVEFALSPMTETGLFPSVAHNMQYADQKEIFVYVGDDTDSAKRVDVSEARITEATGVLNERLASQLRAAYEKDASALLSDHVFRWLADRLPKTLDLDKSQTDRARQIAALAVQPTMAQYTAGESTLAQAGERFDLATLQLLRNEWQAAVAQMPMMASIARMCAYGGMVAALYLLCGGYIYFVDDRRLLLDWLPLFRILGLVVVTIIASFYASIWRFESFTLVVGSLTAAIVYSRDLALLLMAATCLALSLLIDAGIADLVTMAAVCTSSILMLGRIRSRSHLLFVGGGSAAISAATVMGVGIVTGQQATALMDATVSSFMLDPLLEVLATRALIVVGCVIFASITVTGLLVLIEKSFGVQTDLSLLELGNASHPLLRKLAQRAPGTYNHSINVASIAEAAADSIGCNGLLLRVGAYFHDIGKMFKPEYFIENQGEGPNQHDALQPAMSTLVIIAHVKDGVDLARKNGLPESIVEFISQHHGTTLVEYFYREAAKRSEEDPNRETVADKDFRYPGPKPQTLEAAVLMLADTIESASRALVDPTPARIAGLVESIALKKLTDGQFDECGLTLRQLDQVKQSLVKSVTAIYHARVKYPQAG